MRKTTKTITEVTHEHGVISFEIPLYERLLDIASLDTTRDEHVDLITERSIKISEEIDGEPLKLDHLHSIVAGIPAEVTQVAKADKTILAEEE
jgi:hypothetical protein